MHSSDRLPAAVLSVRPVILGEALQVRVTAPVSGTGLPIIVFSHGFGQSMDSYAPLVEHWAAHGFAVFQPTHLDSHTLAVGPGDSRYPDIWRLRGHDLRSVLDNLDVLEAALPGLAGRTDRGRIAVAGHSWGGQTASMLLGARVVGDDVDLYDPRVTTGILLTTPGAGGDDLSPFAAENFSFMHPDFTGMRTPALVIAGDQDKSPLTVRGPEWFTDPFHLSPGPKTLLTIFGAEHTLGGISGYRNAETTDENPERVALVQRVTTAFLRGELTADAAGELGQIETK